MAVQEGKDIGQNYVGTEHILLALLEEDVDDDNVDEVINVPAPPPELALLRRSERIRIGVAAPDRPTIVTKIRES